MAAADTEPRSPGQILRGLLAQKGWSQKEFSRRSGLSQAYISDMCRGNRGVSADTAVIFERVLGSFSAEMWMQMEMERKLRDARTQPAAVPA